MSRPLDGITVVAVEQAVAAPFATRQLADLGARVIKIERPGRRRLRARLRHDGQGLVELLRVAESIEGIADARSQADPDARGAARRLLAQADVFVAEPGARRGRSAAASRAARSSRASPAPDRVQRLRLRIVRAVCARRKRTTCSCRARSGLLSLTGTGRASSQGRHLGR